MISKEDAKKLSFESKKSMIENSIRQTATDGVTHTDVQVTEIFEDEIKIWLKQNGYSVSVNTFNCAMSFTISWD